MRRVRLIVILLGLIVAAAACQADVLVEVEVEPDGTGTVAVEVSFDAPALGEAAAEIAVADLAEAGWSATHPVTEPDGSTTIRAVKAVASPDDLAAVLDEIAGPGVFEDVSILVENRFASRRQRLSFTVDVSDGWDLAADSGVVAAYGAPFAEIADELSAGSGFDQVVSVTVTARTWATEGATPVESIVEPRAGGARLPITAESIVESTTAVLVRWIAYALTSLFALSVVLAATGWWLQRRADRLRPAATPAALTMKIPGQKRQPQPRPEARPIADQPKTGDPVRLVVVEPLAVLYQQQATSQTYLLEFVRHNGGTAPADTILDCFDRLLSGRASTADLWAAAEVEGSPGDIDEIFVKMRGLRSEVSAFLAEMERRRVPVAAVSNDAQAWSGLVRDRDRLTSIWPWLVSGAVGAPKHNVGIFELLHRQTGIAFEHCLFVDTDLAALATARELGIRTALFDPDGTIDESSVAHPVITDLRHLAP